MSRAGVGLTVIVYLCLFFSTEELALLKYQDDSVRFSFQTLDLAQQANSEMLHSCRRGFKSSKPPFIKSKAVYLEND